MRTASPGPGNGWRQTNSSSSPSVAPSARTSSLNSARSGSTRANRSRSGSPPTLWWLLIRRRRADHRNALDHVGIERALRQEVEAADARRHALEHVDERRADDLPLAFRVRHPGQAADEVPGCVLDHQRQLHPVLETPADLVRLVQAQQAVVDEDARQPAADGAVQEQRRHRRVDPAAQPAYHPPLLADLAAYAADGLVREGGHRPVSAAAADVAGEVPQDVRAAVRMRHLGMEQEAVQPPRRVLHRRDGGVGARRRHLEAPRARRQRGRRGWPRRSARRPRPAAAGWTRAAPPPRGRTRAPGRDRPGRRARASSPACRSRCRAPARRRRIPPRRSAARGHRARSTVHRRAPGPPAAACGSRPARYRTAGSPCTRKARGAAAQ